MTGYTVERISIDGIDETRILAQHDPSVRWNGWLCPKMDAWSAVKVLEYLATQADEEFRIRWEFREGGTLWMSDPDYETEDGYTGETWEPDEDGLYAMGAWGWVWSADPEPFPRGALLVEYNEHGGIRHAVTTDEYMDKISREDKGWIYDEDADGVDATGPEGTYHRYQLRRLDRHGIVVTPA